MSTQRFVLDPHVERQAAGGARLARLSSLRGLTVALVDNSKPQGGVFLEELGFVLRRDHGVAATVVVRKPSAARHVTDEDLAFIGRNAQAAVTGVGD